MSDYLISASEPTDLRIDPLEFVEKLRMQWPDAEIYMPADITSGLRWRLPIGIPPLDGRLYETFDTIGLDGYPKECAQFAVWYRKFVPSKYRLILYDPALNHGPVELESETSAQTIIDALTS